MKEYRPINPPEEVEEIEYIKCDHCEDSFEDHKTVILSFGKYCKNCCDNYVEQSINYGFSDAQIDKDMNEFKKEYKLTFNTEYK